MLFRRWESRRRSAGLLAIAAAAAMAAAPASADELAGRPAEPEFAAMLRMILKDGARMGPGSGWFKPGQAARGWPWLAATRDADADGVVSPAEFRGPAPLFARLDRDRDGAVTADDFDWSMRSAYFQQLMTMRGPFRPFDADADGRLSREEFLTLFDRLSQGGDAVSLEELARAMVPPWPPRGAPRGAPPGGPKAEPLPPHWAALRRGLSGFDAFDWLFGKTVPSPEMPSRWTLLQGLFTAEIGSPFEGPKVGDPAPLFTLKTHDGQAEISLLNALARGPVVLVFGSFT